MMRLHPLLAAMLLLAACGTEPSDPLLPDPPDPDPPEEPVTTWSVTQPGVCTGCDQVTFVVKGPLPTTGFEPVFVLRHNQERLPISSQASTPGAGMVFTLDWFPQDFLPPGMLTLDVRTPNDSALVATLPGAIEVTAPRAASAATIRVTLDASGSDVDSTVYLVNRNNCPFDCAEYRVGVGAEPTDLLLPPNISGAFVELVGLAPNCTVQGATQASLPLVRGQVAPVSFAYTCSSMGEPTVRITTRVTGDPASGRFGLTTGLHRQCSGDYGGYPWCITSIGANSSVNVHASSGPFSATLNLASNCTALGSMTQVVQVLAGQVAEMAFDVRCD